MKILPNRIKKTVALIEPAKAIINEINKIIKLRELQPSVTLEVYVSLIKSLTDISFSCCTKWASYPKKVNTSVV
jgi:hypothetical protein